MLKKFVMKWLNIPEPVKPISDENIEKAAGLLFPPLEDFESPTGEAFVVDRSIDTNLEAILQDIQDGQIDEVTVENLKACIATVITVRELFDIAESIKDQSHYLLVDKPRTE